MTLTILPGASTDYVSSLLESNNLYTFIAGISSWKNNKAILDITQDTQAVVTLVNDHEFEIGDTIYFENVEGMISINSISAEVVAITSDTITVDVDTTVFSPYSNSGSCYSITDYIDEAVAAKQIKNKIVGLKRIFSTEMCYVIQNNEWVIGSLYTAFDDSIISDTCYTINKNRIYLCVGAGTGVSTYEPTSTNKNTVTIYPDGYTWLFLQEATADDIADFKTTDWFPVRSEDTFATDIGTVSNIIIDSIGQNYSHLDTVTIYGDGEGAEAAIFKFGIDKSITSIRVTNPGSGYTWADAYVTSSSGTGCSLSVQISPGFANVNPSVILPIHKVRIISKLEGDEEENLYVGEIRSIGVLRDTVNEFSEDAIDSRSSLSIDGDTSLFAIGSTITGQISGTVAIVTGIGDTVLKYSEQNGTGFVSGEIIKSGTNTAIITEVNEFDYNQFSSAEILYINNFDTPFTRNSNQIDTFAATIGI